MSLNRSSRLETYKKSDFDLLSTLEKPHNNLYRDPSNFSESGREFVRVMLEACRKDIAEAEE